jgi:hypothetical protein
MARKTAGASSRAAKKAIAEANGQIARNHKTLSESARVERRSGSVLREVISERKKA